MFAWLKLLDPRIWIALALVVVTTAVLGYTYHLGGEGPRAELAAKVKAEQAAALQRMKNVERTNEENDRRTAALNARLAELLRKPPADLGPAPAGSRCPEGQLCFDGPEFTRARGEFYSEVRQIAGEGTKVGIDLGSAKDFERGN